MSMSPPMDRPALLAALRARVSRMERAEAAEALARQRDRGNGDAILLAPAIDAALPGGAGLPRAALHEILQRSSGAATGFAALLLARSGGTVFWIAPSRDAWPPGLSRFGLPHTRLILVRAAGAADALWAAEEALRCPAVGGVLLAGHRPDDTAAHRLQLAAETGGGIGLLLREDTEESRPGVAITRWRVSGRAGTGLSRHQLGDPQWRLELLRTRSTRPARWDVAWRPSSETLIPENPSEEDAACDDVPAARLA